MCALAQNRLDEAGDLLGPASDELRSLLNSYRLKNEIEVFERRKKSGIFARVQLVRYCRICAIDILFVYIDAVGITVTNQYIF